MRFLPPNYFFFKNICKSTLQPITSFPQSKTFVFGDNCVKFLTPDVTTEIENSLLTRQDGKCPLNLAVRALLEQERWKTVPLAEWGKSFYAKIIEKVNSKLPA
ncbi:hypothetical protein OESDEN_07115 [Oesophagostomum dentatum]|uniref:Uncharacterized protein n=1 Tax=Oesophagostomum dentatum TaxID=61180 RepID=A0A0B1TB03_OESDE|nr:hypothetical protein OESDEN_07115 [Oesophagostomum dentatum]